MSLPGQLFDCEAVAQELLRQPEFFRDLEDSKSTGNEVAVVPRLAVERYTGSRSTADETKMLHVGAMRLLGFSDREIERKCGVDRRTIPHLLAELEKTKRIPAVKERLLVVVSDVAERTGLVLRRLLDRAESGECSTELAAMIKSVGTVTGISSEKVLLLTGSATEIVEHKVGAGREEFEAWWRDRVVPVTSEVTRAGGAFDSKSAVDTSVSEGFGGFDGVGHGQDTSSGPDGGQADTLEGPTATAVSEVGGGVLGGAGVQMFDESTGSQNCSQEPT
jgi:hypothetical protein